MAWKYRVLMPIMALTLSACSLFPIKFVPYTDYLAYPTQETPAPTDHDYVPENYTVDYTEMFRSHRWEQEKTINLRSTGAQKLLVIPVAFSDVPAASLAEGASGSKALIENAFFGNANRTRWASVASYYNQSSYGALRLSGSVSDWYDCGYSVNDILTMADAHGKTYVSERLLEDAVAWYKLQYTDIRDYDADDDGYIDAVYLIYSAPYQTRTSLLWAYTSFDTGNLGSEHLTDPVTNAYAWSSYAFLNVYNGKPDTHTLIHETGHLFGLADYYNTSAGGLVSGDATYNDTYGPTGRVDMMDYSVGDQTVYSKMALNWTRPHVVTDSGAVTIRPFVSSGDCILVKNGWNGAATDEYLALEFYAPLGLNYADSEAAYGAVRLMRNYGIKVYHVDARLGYYRTDGSGLFLGYVNDTPVSELPADVQGGTYYTKVAHTNTPSTSEDGYPLYHLLESNGANSFLSGASATDATLFAQGDTFGIDTFTDFVFDDGTPLGYTFTISALSRQSATITFTKAA